MVPQGRNPAGPGRVMWESQERYYQPSRYIDLQGDSWL